MGLLVVLNTNSIGLLVVLNTNSMGLVIALNANSMGLLISLNAKSMGFFVVQSWCDLTTRTSYRVRSSFLSTTTQTWSKACTLTLTSSSPN